MRFPSLAAMLDRTVRYRPIGLGTRAVRSNRRPSKRRALTRIPISDLGSRLSNPGTGRERTRKIRSPGPVRYPSFAAPVSAEPEGKRDGAGRDGIGRNGTRRTTGRSVVVAFGFDRFGAVLCGLEVPVVLREALRTLDTRAGLGVVLRLDVLEPIDEG